MVQDLSRTSLFMRRLRGVNLVRLELDTIRLRLRLQSSAENLAQIDALPPAERAEVSTAWLALLHASPQPDPWIHGFTILHRESGQPVGACGFKGPPADERVVEIAYGIAESQRGHGYATEAAQALTQFAFDHPAVRTVRAHTERDGHASQRVLTKCGFLNLGEVIDPEDGLVLRWERTR